MVSLYPIPVSYLLTAGSRPFASKKSVRMNVKNKREGERENFYLKKDEFSRERCNAREEDRNRMKNKIIRKKGGEEGLLVGEGYEDGSRNVYMRKKEKHRRVDIPIDEIGSASLALVSPSFRAFSSSS